LRIEASQGQSSPEPGNQLSSIEKQNSLYRRLLRIEARHGQPSVLNQAPTHQKKKKKKKKRTFEDRGQSGTTQCPEPGTHSSSISKGSSLWCPGAPGRRKSGGLSRTVTNLDRHSQKSVPKFPIKSLSRGLFFKCRYLGAFWRALSDSHEPLFKLSRSNIRAPHGPSNISGHNRQHRRLNRVFILEEKHPVDIVCKDPCAHLQS